MIIEITQKNTRAKNPNGNSFLQNQKHEIITYTHSTPRDLLYSSITEKKLHPTQKPLEILEYLIKTYTLKGETVLDFTMGSGSTGVSCLNTERNFIGIKLNKRYFDITCNWIEKVEYVSKCLELFE